MDGFAHCCPTCGQGVTSDFIVSLDTNHIMVRGKKYRVSADEAVVAHVLVKAYPARVSYEALIAALWAPINEPENPLDCIKVKVSTIRRKTRGSGLAIVVTYGHGYRLVDEHNPKFGKQGIRIALPYREFE